MRCADGDEDAGFADFEPAEAVGDSDAINGEERVKRGGDFAHFLEGHGFVGFVFEIERFATVGLVADAAVEGDDGAVFGLAHVANEGISGDGFADEEDEVIVGGEGHGIG